MRRALRPPPQTAGPRQRRPLTHPGPEDPAGHGRRHLGPGAARRKYVPRRREGKRGGAASGQRSTPRIPRRRIRRNQNRRRCAGRLRGWGRGGVGPPGRGRASVGRRPLNPARHRRAECQSERVRSGRESGVGGRGSPVGGRGLPAGAGPWAQWVEVVQCTSRRCRQRVLPAPPQRSGAPSCARLHLPRLGCVVVHVRDAGGAEMKSRCLGARSDGDSGSAWVPCAR